MGEFFFFLSFSIFERLINYYYVLGSNFLNVKDLKNIHKKKCKIKLMSLVHIQVTKFILSTYNVIQTLGRMIPASTQSIKEFKARL